MSASIKQQSLSGIKWSAIERFLVQGIQFLIGMFLARLLSPSDYGVVGMLSIFIAISQTFIDSGFSSALIQKQDRTETDFSTVFYFNIVVGLVCYLILFLLASYIAIFFNTPVLKDVLKIMALSLFINSMAVVPVAKLSIDLNFKTQTQASVTSVIISGIIGVFMAYYDYGVWALVTQSVIYAIINVSLLWYLVKWKPLLSYSWDSFRVLFKYGSNILFSGLLHTIYDNLSTLAIGKFYTAKDLGFYTRGNQFPSLLSINLTYVLRRVTFPVLARIQNDDKRLIHVYRNYIKITSLIIFFLLALLASLAKPLVEFLLTDKWLDAVIYIQIFCYALMFDHICQINLNLLYVKGKTNLVLRLEIIKKAISFLILIGSIPLGVFAICLSKVVYSQIAVYINTYYTGKLFSLGYFKQIKDFTPYLILAHLACIPCWLLQRSVNIHPLLILVVGGIIAIAVYIALLYYSKDEIFHKHIATEIKHLF